ncbi:hypothetical protein MMG00_02960 [Ignatzschineria rhizosphaerae]|uniref:Uncharacterized protein n=1 Tax=Ignatzschineria rhizosphaerae TaxID=2923279 RepID=A0ABY3X709_9GAMM|nr:hypothetical protein [Ignatzschineria rhizosphaerae]UNM96832.1 hypothetical protein MMG00_02960 [Ignatzschineria rhizosphaerae]
MIEVIDKKYSKPFYYEPDIPRLVVVEKQVKFLYENHQFLSGPNVSVEEVGLANDAYSLLKEGLEEVHKLSRCLEWKL